MEQQNKKEKKISEIKSLKNIATGMFYYNAFSILGPLIFLVGAGILLDNFLKTKPYLTITGLIIAFIVTNILMFKRIKKLSIKLKKEKIVQNNKQSIKQS